MTIRFLPLDIYKRHLSLPVRKKCPIHNLPPFTGDYILYSQKRVKFHTVYIWIHVKNLQDLHGQTTAKMLDWCNIWPS